VQKTADNFARHTKDSNWETLAQRRQIARTCAVFKAHTGERAWKATCDRLQRTHYLSRVDNDWKIRNTKQMPDIGKCFFVNRTIQVWNQLPAEAVGNLSCKLSNFRKRVRKVINEMT
jgi:hypothetical protein